MFRSVVAVLSAPVVYGALCLPANWLVVKLFPGHFDKNWVTSHTGILVLLVSQTIFYAGASGFVGAYIARHHIMWHALAICALQLSIGIAVQRQYWTVLPLWYHYAFFLFLITGILLGATVWETSTTRATSQVS